MKTMVDYKSHVRSPVQISISASPDRLEGASQISVPRMWKSGDTHKYFDLLGVRSVLLVADDQAYARSGAEMMLRRSLRSCQVVRFSDFTANPKSHEIDRAVEAFRSEQFDLIVAVGGGSAMDVAKLARACDQENASAADVIERRVPVVAKGPPLLAIPTTAGTGAEATHFSAV